METNEKLYASLYIQHNEHSATFRVTVDIVSTSHPTLTTIFFIDLGRLICGRKNTYKKVMWKNRNQLLLL